MEVLNPFLTWGGDLLLAGALVWLAGQALFSREPFRAVVHFVAFGLLMTLVWVRLRAPDVALAEAAIGAGLTGALLLSHLKRVWAVTEKELEESAHAAE